MYKLSDEYIASLTNLYCEAYSLYLKKKENIDSIVSNINKKMQENILNSDDIKITDYTVMLLLNSILFNNHWSKTFDDKDNYTDKFYSINGEQEATYMYHNFVGKVKEYEDYVVFDDYLTNGYSVRYYVTKKRDDDISTLITKEDYLSGFDSEEMEPTVIKLSLPKFSFKNTVKFNDTLKDIGLDMLFNDKLPNFNNCFTFKDKMVEEETTTWIENSLQSTSVNFDNDGTTFKSVQATTIGTDGSAAPIDGNYEIKLENPFIFEIRDSNNLPILFGNLKSIE